jgi:hypothetical protein
MAFRTNDIQFVAYAKTKGLDYNGIVQDSSLQNDRIVVYFVFDEDQGIGELLMLWSEGIAMCNAKQYIENYKKIRHIVLRCVGLNY